MTLSGLVGNGQNELRITLIDFALAGVIFRLIYESSSGVNGNTLSPKTERSESNNTTSFF